MNNRERPDWVDKLIAHLRSCPTCRLARAFPSSRYCTHGQTLIQQTLKERHG